VRNEVDYEWVWEYSDSGEDKDIHDLAHGDTLANLGPSNLDYYAKQRTVHGDLIVRAELALTRNVGNDLDGLLEKDYAYVKNNELPEFVGDFKVPQKFHNELKTFVQNVGLGNLGNKN